MNVVLFIIFLPLIVIFFGLGFGIIFGGIAGFLEWLGMRPRKAPKYKYYNPITREWY